MGPETLEVKKEAPKTFALKIISLVASFQSPYMSLCSDSTPLNVFLDILRIRRIVLFCTSSAVFLRNLPPSCCAPTGTSGAGAGVAVVIGNDDCRRQVSDKRILKYINGTYGEEQMLLAFIQLDL